MEPTTRAKGHTSCRYSGSSEVDKSSKTESYQIGKRTTVKELQKEKTIIVLPAVKGKATVVMEKHEKPSE